MPVVCFSETKFYFPPVSQADEEGLLIIGGKVTPERVLDGYARGIFPWYNEDSLPMWWSPNPRFVIFPEQLHISRSMRKLLKRSPFEFRTDTAFEQVIDACASVPRTGQNGTWITANMKLTYLQLHRDGFAHSAETWIDGRLVGGVYGVKLGNVFFGESMFSKENNASKFAFVNYVRSLQDCGVSLIDCQVHTPHVETLGGRLIPREYFVHLLRQHCEVGTV